MRPKPVFGDIVYVLEFSHTAGDDRTEWMPRIRKLTPDGESTITLTVDQMPGAQPSKVAASASNDVFWVELGGVSRSVWAVIYYRGLMLSKHDPKADTAVVLSERVGLFHIIGSVSPTKTNVGPLIYSQVFACLHRRWPSVYTISVWSKL